MAIWNKVYDAIDKFGITQAEFLPYWKRGTGIQAPEGVLVSAYRRDGRSLLAVMNTGEATTARLRPEPAHAGSAVDVYRDETIPLAGDVLPVRLKRREGRLIELRDRK